MTAPNSQAAAGDLEVRPVADRRERRLFLRLPWRIYRSDPLWVPPLLSAADEQLDPKRHPFFEHAEIRLFLAWRGGDAVGRIAGIVNHLYNSLHRDATGFWGFFEAERDPAVVRALLDAVADDLRRRGKNRMMGPFNPSTNAECGLLVEGFDRPPVVLMPYNPPYYPELVEEAGHRREQDLFAYFLESAQVARDRPTRARLERIARAVERRRPGLVVRPLDMSRYEEEVTALGEVFNEARRNNWAYVPATPAELHRMAREMKPIVVPDLILVAEHRGRRVGCLLALPDINPILRKLNGRLFPLGWARLLRERRRMRRFVRVFGAACLPEYRNLGVTVLLFEHFIRNGLRLGCEAAELSWVAEGNVVSVRTLLAAFKPRLYKRYRVYTREL